MSSQHPILCSMAYIYMLADPQGSAMHLTFWRIFDQCQTMPEGVVCSHINFGRTESCRDCGTLWQHCIGTVSKCMSHCYCHDSLRQLTDSIRQLRQTSDSLQKPRQVTFEYWASKACSASTNRAVPPALWTAAIACNASVVLPLLSGPYTCTIMHDHHCFCARTRKRKGYAFRRQSNEKPSITPDCPTFVPYTCTAMHDHP